MALACLVRRILAPSRINPWKWIQCTLTGDLVFERKTSSAASEKVSDITSLSCTQHLKSPANSHFGRLSHGHGEVLLLHNILLVSVKRYSYQRELTATDRLHLLVLFQQGSDWKSYLFRCWFWYSDEVCVSTCLRATRCNSLTSE